MTIIDRPGTPVDVDELEVLARLEPGRSEGGPSPSESVWSRPALVLLAALSAAAGAIHLAMVPAHSAEWLAAGVSFAVAGWLQIGFAVAFVVRPSRLALRLSCIANVVFIAAWLVTRIWGWPIGPEAGIPEAATFVDVVCVAFEACLVVGGYELLAKPGLGSRISRSALVMLSVVPLGVLILATMAIASPSASSHSHGGSTVEAGAHDHGGGTGQSATADHNDDHGAAAPADDKGLSLIMNGAGEGGGHVHNTSVVPVDASTQAQLDAQLAKMKPLIDKYPTVKDAEAAGYHRQGPYSPGLGAHYAEAGAGFLNTQTTMTDQALQHPMLIFDGVSPDSKLAGFMYMIFSLDTQNAPEGFVGPNDHWHYHTNVCIVPRADGGTDAPLGADSSATKELCDKYPGGILVANTGYMVHVWPVPGYESPQGLFSNLNPKLACPNGTYYTVSQEEIGTRSNVCRDVSN
jgi:hypothetical protein